jgi:hypothetical protein
MGSFASLNMKYVELAIARCNKSEDSNCWSDSEIDDIMPYIKVQLPMLN